MSRFICSTCGVDEVINFSVFPSNPFHQWQSEWDEDLKQLIHFCSEQCKEIYYEVDDEELFFFDEDDFDDLFLKWMNKGY